MTGKNNPSAHWRKKFRRGLVWMARSLVWPVTLNAKETCQRFGVFFVAWHLLYPLTAMFFPRAETVLKEEGLDPKIAQELAPGKRIYIRRAENLGQKIHAIFDRNSFGAPRHYLSRISEKGFSGAYTINGLFSGVNILFLFKAPIPSVDVPLCRIYMHTRGELKGSAAYGITDAVQYKQVLLHEIAHCAEKTG